MSDSSRFGRLSRSSRPAASKRRPAGVSRRRRKQLGFETLEDRRVMSAESPLASLQGMVDESVGIQVTSLSSSTEEGAQAILERELLWYALQSSPYLGSASSYSIPSDPLVDDQWHLINVGQQVGNPDFQNIFGIPGEDINVAGAWELGYTGDGVVVGVFEPSGFFETTHPDLAANLHPTLAFNGLGFAIEDDHPTAVAGLIGAVADNDEGGTGVAPGVQLVPMSGAGLAEALNIAGFRFAIDNGLDIVNNSWGPVLLDADGNLLPGRGLTPATPLELLALRDSVIFGRDGLGVINVFSSGNDAGSPFDFGFADQGDWDTSAYDGFINTRYTIGVTGVDHDGFYNNIDGTVTSYPETSPSVLVAAPTGSFPYNIADDFDIGSGIVTTDLTGEAGFNSSDNVTPPRDFEPNIDYTSIFNGTSASAPMVSGIAALMLQANPNLHWRDVQEILVRSARQNAEFDIPIAAGVGTTQNTWIQNQMPLFRDPDLWDPTISPLLQTFFPTLDPALSDAGRNSGPGPTPNSVGQALNSRSNTGAHYQPTPQTLTNGAGYTMSQGKGVHGELIGYAHGTVDAELAVRMAEQWHTKNQALPNELTFTSFINPEGGFFINVPAAEVGNIDTGFQYVPGGLGGAAGFIGFWNEYFADMPFQDNPVFPERGSFVELSVPDSNAMTIENVEVKISLLGDTTSDLEFLENMRVVLVSPTGTHHELNHFFADRPAIFSHQNANAYTFEASPALTSSDIDPDNPLVVTFSSNRSWGERSNNAIIFDPTTAEPANTSGNGLHGWQLHFENHSLTTAAGVTGIEVVWHGSPIEANTERIQGLIGVDDNRDDLFNFSRVFLNNSDTDGTLRFGEVTNTIDTSHESMASNITVFIHRDVNGDGILDAGDVLVDQMVVGADGNFYFDVVPDNYIISLDPSSLGSFTALDDSLTPAGFLPDYQSQWAITPDFFQVWDYDANLDVPLNPITGAPFPFLAGGQATQYGMQHINFLLDPGPPPAPQVDFSGTVFADINGDGMFNGDDVAVPGVGVFGDVNRNGALDAGEILTTTDSNGEYLLTVPVTATTVVNVGVRPPANWTATSPQMGLPGFEPQFVSPGDMKMDVDFHIQPPAGTTSGDGSASSGVILGVVFNDSNADMTRQAGEVGVPNLTVFVDMNNSGTIDPEDFVTQTNSNGAYAFANVPNGNHVVRILLDGSSGIFQTFPDFDLPQVAAIISGGTATDINFGVSSGGGGGPTGGTFDYGDLPLVDGIDVYGTTGPLAARHPMGFYFLGDFIDAEPDGLPTADADGDDLNFLPDEDGVVLTSGGGELVPGTMGTFMVTASRSSGFLQVWMDFDNSGSFSASEQVVVNKLLNTGGNTVTFAIPAVLEDVNTGDPLTFVYTRVRYGEFGLGSTGTAQIGEVEDYKFNVDAPDPPLVVIHGPDFDEDGMVSGLDFLAWQLGQGMTSGATAADGDSNSDGAVDGADLADWNDQFGAGSSSPASTVQTGDFNQDGQVSGMDFLAWQVNAGMETGAALRDGDGNLDDDVDANDLVVWEDSYGTDVTGSSAPLGAESQSSIAAASSLSTPTVAEPTGTDLAAPALHVESSETTIPSSRPSNEVLGFVASELQHRLALARRVDREDFGFWFGSRIETYAQDTSVQDAVGLVDQALELRDRAVDGLFGRRDRLFDQLPFSQDREASETIGALEEVLSEEMEFRFV